MMRTLKTITLSTLVILFAFSLTLYTSCQKDDCKGVNCLNGGSCEDGFCKCPTGWTGPNCEYDACTGVQCLNGGTCVTGNCICPLGFEGTFCEVFTRNKFLGIWMVTEDGTASAPTQYTVSVSAGIAYTAVKISNLRVMTDTLSATINGDTLTIPEQTVNGHTLQGSGIISDHPVYGENGLFTLRYTIKYQNGTIDEFGLNSGSPSLWNR